LFLDTDGDKRMNSMGCITFRKGEFNVFLWLPFMWSGGGVGEC